MPRPYHGPQWANPKHTSGAAKGAVNRAINASLNGRDDPPPSEIRRIANKAAVQYDQHCMGDGCLEDAGGAMVEFYK